MPLGLRDAQSPRAPGTLAAHYAPATELILASTVELEAMRGRGDIAILGRPQCEFASDENNIAVAASPAGFGRV